MTLLESTKKSNKIMIILFLALVLSGLVITQSVFTGEKFHISQKVLQKIQEKYGQEAVKRLNSWEDVLQRSGATDMEKLQRVNAFFNKTIIFMNDIDVWGVKDYWATPVEFLSRGTGDCEDFAIAKYFSLKSMGVADAKLRIAYVKALQYNMTHMVMAYYSSPEAEPLILDNLVDSIEPASQRKDLLPIFTFNGTGLWTARDRGRGNLAGKPSRLAGWTDLMKKMTEESI